MLATPKILVLTDDANEMRRLESVLAEYVLLRHIRNLAELHTLLQDGGYDALLCTWSFANGGWAEALKEAQVYAPDLPVIVFSQNGGEREWIQVLEAGAFDLLVEPYWKRSVLPALEQAVDSYAARRHRSTAARLVKAN